MQKSRIIEIEEEVDKYLYDQVDENLPRYKFVFHMNLVFIDFVIEKKLWFTNHEKYFSFSLNYNIFIAYKKLIEEEKTDFCFDSELYKECQRYLILGMQYALLCDVFPAIRDDKASFTIDEPQKTIKIEYKTPPKNKHEFLSKYLMKKSLSYTLQYTAGLLEDEDLEGASHKLAHSYLSFWNENMMYEDFEIYSREDWGGINYFFILASMRRFIKLYRNDFNNEKITAIKTMVVLSSKEQLLDFTLSQSQEKRDAVLKDLIYKPLGNGLFPKSNILDAPIIQTKDGFLFLNPLIMLSNSSNETMLLNNLRKIDRGRYLIIKDRLKERVIPLISYLVKFKYPRAIVITNFKLPIPNTKNNKRELDILLIDDATGFALYIEVKHFFNPSSISEIKSLDDQLNIAINKVPAQLNAIEENWDLLKEKYNLKSDLIRAEAVILSHSYLGKEIEVNQKIPIIDTANFFESISETNTIQELYFSNKTIDEIYSSVPFISKDIKFNYANYNFNFVLAAISPQYEKELIKSYRKMVFSNIDFEKPTVFKSIEEHAKALLERMQANNID